MVLSLILFASAEVRSAHYPQPRADFSHAARIMELDASSAFSHWEALKTKKVPAASEQSTCLFLAYLHFLLIGIFLFLDHGLLSIVLDELVPCTCCCHCYQKSRTCAHFTAFSHLRDSAAFTVSFPEQGRRAQFHFGLCLSFEYTPATALETR